MKYRVTLLLFLCLVIFLSQLLSFSPFLSYHWLFRKKLEVSPLSESSSGEIEYPSRSVNIDLSKELNFSTEGTKSKHHGIFAPIFIGAGFWGNSSHVLLEVSCDLGFVSFHGEFGCFPKNIFESKEFNKTRGRNLHLNEESNNVTCSLSISSAHEHYQSLLHHHENLFRISLDEYEYAVNLKEEILHHLSVIVEWGIIHKIGLALHGHPYQLLVPEIMKLVGKLYGGNSHSSKNMTTEDFKKSYHGDSFNNSNYQPAKSNSMNSTFEELGILRDYKKPIILLREMSPTASILNDVEKPDEVGSWICKPTTHNLTHNDEINPTTLCGGAFDIMRCIDNALPLNYSTLIRIENGTATNKTKEIAKLPLQAHTHEIVCTVNQAIQSHHEQFIVKEMQQYINGMKTISVVSYDPSLYENLTSRDELIIMTKQSMADALMDENGRFQMREGIDFLGFHQFFSSLAVEERWAHRRRHHGDFYGDGSASAPPISDQTDTSYEDIFLSGGETQHLEMLRFKTNEMKPVTELDREIWC